LRVDLGNGGGSLTPVHSLSADVFFKLQQGGICGVDPIAEVKGEGGVFCGELFGEQTVCSRPSTAGYQLIFISDLTHQRWVDDALGVDGFGERLYVAEVLTEAFTIVDEVEGKVESLHGGWESIATDNALSHRGFGHEELMRRLLLGRFSHFLDTCRHAVDFVIVLGFERENQIVTFECSEVDVLRTSAVVGASHGVVEFSEPSLPRR